MYANSMLIILPNDVSCCWQERADGGGRKEEDEPVLSHVGGMDVFRHKHCKLFYYIFIPLDLSSVLGYAPVRFH